MKIIFLSMPSSESALEKRLKKQLKRIAHVKIVGAADIKPGSNIATAIKNQLRVADLVVSVLPETAEESPNVWMEYGAARILERPRIAVLLQERGGIPGVSTQQEEVYRYKGDIGKLATRIVKKLPTEKKKKMSVVSLDVEGEKL